MAKSKLMLGTVQFGIEYGINNKDGVPSIKEVFEILDFAYNNGVRFLDTAEAYGDSQSVIGKFHLQNNNKFKIVTKFSPLRKDLPNNIKERVLKNLNTLNISSLYCYMFHSFLDYKKYFNVFKYDLLHLKKVNKIEKIGVSLHSNEDLVEVLNDENIDIIQIPFNLFDNSNQREYYLKLAKKRGIEIHTRSVFLQGLFFKEIKKLSGNLVYFKEYLKILNRIVKKDQINSVALNYAYSKNFIDYVLIGVDNLNHLKSNLNLVDCSVEKEIISKIDKIKVENNFMLNPVNWIK